MTGYSNGVPKKKLAKHDKPVLFSASGSSTWHVPEIRDGKAYFLCGYDDGDTEVKVVDHGFFQRRRNPKQCESCAQRVDGKYTGVDIDTDEPKIDGWRRMEKQGKVKYEREDREMFVLVGQVTSRAGTGYQATVYKQSNPYTADCTRITSEMLDRIGDLPDLLAEWDGDSDD